MKKQVVILAIVLSGVLAVSCSNKTGANVKIVRDGAETIEKYSEQSTSEPEIVSAEPVPTEEPIAVTEEPILFTDEPVTVKSSNTAKPVKNNKKKSDTKKQKEDNNDGDVVYETGTSSKFVNNSEFYISVPKEVFTMFSSSIPNDILDTYPDLTFVYYDKDTKNIYAKSEEYYFEFKYYEDFYSMDSELKEYADWWKYD